MATEVKERARTDYTEGSIIGSILKMGLPSMFGFLIQHIYAMIDMLWVSKLGSGESGVAAVTFFTNLMWLLFAFNHLIGPGSVAIISRRYGEKAYDLTESAIKETFLLKLASGFIVAIVSWFILPDALSLLGATGESLDLGVAYGRILLFGLPIMYCTYSVFTALRGVANPNIAMILMFGSSFLNMALDPVFMFGYMGLPEFGIRGAAIASVASFALTFLIGLILFNSSLVNVKLNYLSLAGISAKSMGKMLKIGLPAWLGEASWSSSRLVITPIIATFGMSVVAAYGVSMQLFALGISVLVGVGLGLSSLIGHNLGGQKVERARKTADAAIYLATAFMTVFGVLVYVLAEFYMRQFFTDPQTIAEGVKITQITALGFPFVGAFITNEMIHQGVGQNTPPMVVSIIHSWLFQVGSALIITKYFGLDHVAVWWALTIAIVVSSTGFYLYYRRGRWLLSQV